MKKSILGLDVSGQPRAWLSAEEAITYHAKGLVQWEHGDHKFTFHGGYKRSGEQSKITSSSIIAIRAASGFTMDKLHKDIPLSNQLLFKRDGYHCGYCGLKFHSNQLSRDHIIPRSRGGLDVWHNVVAACKHCNCKKDDMLLSECGLTLLHKPYAPSRIEVLATQNQFMLDEQLEYIRPLLPKHSRLVSNLIYT